MPEKPIPHPQYPRLVVLKRPRSKFYQSRTYLDGALVQKTLKTDELTLAFRLAEDWYRRQLRASLQKQKQHPIKQTKSSTLVSEVYVLYLKSIREEKHVAEAEMRWSPIAPFWRTIALAEITTGTFEDFYRWRKKVKAITLRKDVGLIAQVLRYASRKYPEFVVPEIPKVGRIEPNPRPWLTREEWVELCKTAEMLIVRASQEGQTRVLRQRQAAYDYARFMVASMCRVEELQTLRADQCRVEQSGTHEILRCEFRGKTGSRVAYASPDAVAVFNRRKTDDGGLLFPEHPRDSFRNILEKATLYRDAFGNRRNYKSLRATAISFAVLNGVDLLWIARNAGTSVQMIDLFYAKRLTSEIGRSKVLASFKPLPDFWAS